LTLKCLKLPVLVGMVAFTPAIVDANVSLLVEEAVGGAGEFTGSGHGAVFFSTLCAESPTKLRNCKAGEEGAVISTYPELGTQSPHKWLALPLTAFLYGVDLKTRVPLYANGKIRKSLREAYRREHLQEVVPDSVSGVMPPGRWSEMLAGVINRDIYALTVTTTPEQDAKLLKDLEGLRNVKDFSATYNNCADFVRDVLNLIFPKATHRDVLNDFTMTTPKAIARSFTAYATKRPELNFHITKYSQIDGAIRRSLNNRNFTEKAIVSKKYFLTMAFTKPELLPIMGATYLITGWYNLDPQYKKYAGQEVTALNSEAQRLKNQRWILNFVYAGPSGVTLKELDRRKDDHRREFFGTDKTWGDYQKRFDPIMTKAVNNGLFLDRAEIQTFFKDLELQSEPAFDGRGELVLKVNDRGHQETLGLTNENILNPNSSRRLAHKLMLAKVNAILHAPSRNRPSLPEFENTWQLLLASGVDVPMYEFAAGDRTKAPRFRQVQEVVSTKKKSQKLLMTITH